MKTYKRQIQIHIGWHIKREVTNMKTFTNTFRMAHKTQLTNMKANRSTNKQHIDQLYIIYTINNIKSTSALTCYRRAEQIWKTISWK